MTESRPADAAPPAGGANGGHSDGPTSARPGTVPSPVPIPVGLARAVHGLVDAYALASLMTPDTAGTTLDLHAGLVGVLPFRPGLTHPSRAWDARVDWAALILFPTTPTPIRFPITEKRLAADTAAAQVHLFPAAAFTERAWHTGGTFQHIDNLGAHAPGTFWINLDDATARGDLTPFQIRVPDKTS
ncbi:hypothetical protein [Actinomadura rupiterrae]|uniref:hypothetical protein n=1 Tax=Actinomadura rupiterrae TaxID=559627 RepID=UPI0020A381F9|nr:hypothetical protein [Actinomadura rupiterrae]MCP2342041.1 hypothetical protein [Actinomadura rupiterrae]